MSSKRNERALRAIRYLRDRETRQNKKIDILCRDIVGAHDEFIRKVSTLSFVLRFQETLLGISDSSSILDATAAYLKESLNGAGVAIFLSEPKGFDIHFSSVSDEFVIEKGHFEQWFTPPLVQEISRCGQVCKLDQMLQMGLQANPSVIKHVTAASIPIGKIGKGVGLIFVYRQIEKEFYPSELSLAASIVPSLHKAVQRTQSICANTISGQ